MAWDKKKHATFTSGMPEDKKNVYWYKRNTEINMIGCLYPC